MKCQKCGNDINSGKRYCQFCGAENVFEGSVPAPFNNKKAWYKKIKVPPIAVFAFIIVLIAVFANFYK